MNKHALFKGLLTTLVLATVAGCTLSTTGLRPPKDHSLAFEAITEVYDKPAAAPAPAPAPPPVCQAPTLGGQPGDLKGCKTGDKIVLRGLNFGVNEATLSIEGKSLLDLVAVALKEAPGIKVQIGGHTDNTGAEEYNLALSKKRVAAVQNYLAVKGISSARMTMKAYGESMPAADNASAEGRALNRRVELIVTDETVSHAAVKTEFVPAPPGGSQVSIVDNAFVPETLTVAPGTSVTWTNAGGSNHIVKFADASSSRLRSGAKYSRTFDSAGTYAYECAIHGSRMSGKVVVQ